MPGALRTPSLSAALVAATLACGGGGGGSSGPKPPPEEGMKLSGIGDSIMEGMDASSPGAQHELSFAQGTDADVDSLYLRYKAASGLPGGQEFVSEVGASMIQDAQAQAVQVCSQSTRPDRIVILLGANDACGASDPASLPTPTAFRSALKSALDELASGGCALAPGTRVHVLSIPQVANLREAGLAKDEADRSTHCQDVWSGFDICPIVTAGSTDSIAAVASAVDSYNDGILAEVAAATAAHGATTGIAFTTDWKGATGGLSIGTATFGADDISAIDCFHPSAQGQRKLACAAWESWEGTGDASACF